MPQMGESLAEGTVVKWHKQVGEKVRRDEPLFEISTDKVDTEIPSPGEGFLVEVLVVEGETVPVNTVVCRLGDTPTGGGRSGKNGAPGEARPQEDGTPAATTNPSVGGGAPLAETIATSPLTSLERRIREKSSPLVRRLAREQGVELASVAGTGASGRVTKEDLFRHVEKRDLGGPEEPGDRTEPMSIMRKNIAEHMLRSRRTSAHASTIHEVDMSAADGRRKSLQERSTPGGKTRFTFLPFVLRAVARTLGKFDSLNATIEGDIIRYHSRVHLGVAVALDDGLLVPVIHDAHEKSVAELARILSDLAERARTKKLRPEEVQGGTFTVTSPGRFGGLIGTPILHQPQTGILYLGAVQKRPVVLPETDAIAVRPMAYLSLSFDHRLVDGAVADSFMSSVRSCLETEVDSWT